MRRCQRAPMPSRARQQARGEDISFVRERDRALIREAYAAVDVAAAWCPGLRRAVDAARANYDQADARFRAGLGTSVELADAENSAHTGRNSTVLGEFELARARARVSANDCGRTVK